MSGASTELQKRLDAVFGSLSSGTESHSTWQPRTELVTRSGKRTDAEDEEERTEAREEERRLGALPGLDELLEEDEDDAPTFTFCRAVDKEEEYSNLDALAGGVNEDRPTLDTPIVDFDNGSDVPPKEQRAQPSHAGIWPSPAKTSHKRQQVRLSDGSMPAASKVPDHVLHPERYTRYDLEEPLVVGGGVGQLGMAEEGPVPLDHAGPSDDNLVLERRNEDSVQPMDVGTVSTSEAEPPSTHSRILYRPTTTSRIAGSERQEKPDPNAFAGRQLLSLEDDTQETQLSVPDKGFSVVKAQRKSYRSRRPLESAQEQT